MKRLMGLLMAISLILVLNVLPASSHTEAQPFVTDLVADKTVDVGDVLVWNDGENLYIKYVATGEWCITDTHLHVGEDPGEIPQTKKGNPKPGRFTYKDSFKPCVAEAPYTIPLGDWGPVTDLYIAAHAVVSNGSKHETAWGKGDPFPWKNWAMYFMYTIQGSAPGTASITIKKLTNEVDVDTTPGPNINVGDPVEWKYVITNTGDVNLTDVTVTDDPEGAVTCPKTELTSGEYMTCNASGIAVEGRYDNKGTAKGTPPTGPEVTAEDLSYYIGIQQGPAITIKKYTNGEDANISCPSISAGAEVTWTYVVTNTGNVTLTDIEVSDDPEGAVSCPKTELTSGEYMTCNASGIAVEGNYENTGTATGTPGQPTTVMASDTSCYKGVPAAITIEEITASPNVLWPPNHKMVPVTITVTFTGNGTPTPTCEIISVASNEPENGLGDGDTSPDWEFAGSSLNLRAERGGDGNGRIYTITVQCTDTSNNTAQGTVEVTVPHDKGKKK